MGKQKVKEKRGVIRITNRLGKFEWISPEEWKILTNRVVPGLLPVAVEQKGKKTTLEVSVSGVTTLSEYNRQPMEMQTILAFLSSTMQIALDCERYGLRVESLCWDPDRVYVDLRSGTVMMLYWPVISLDQSSAQMLQFYGSFIQIMKHHGMLRGIYDVYKAYFYQRDVFDLRQFQRMMQSVMEGWSQYEQRQDERQRRAREREEDDPWGVRLTGGGSAWLEEDVQSEKLWLASDQTTIGRDPSQCGMVIPGDDGLSRRHAMIENRDGKYYLLDLGSRNGTWLNGKRLPAREPRELQDGAEIRFSNSTYIFRTIQTNRTVAIHYGQRREP